MNTIDQLNAYPGFAGIEFPLYAANMYHLFGTRILADHICAYEAAYDYHDQQAATVPADLDGVPFDKRFWQANQPGMIVTFHYGAYRRLPMLMLRHGLRISILIAREVLQEQQAYYEGLYGQTANLRYIVAEGDNVYFEVKRSLADGYHILCYADGGKGRQQETDGRHTDRIKLVRGKVYVRTGFAHMAYLTSCPIYATWMRADNAGYGATLIMDPKEFDDRLIFAKTAIDRIYKAFAGDLCTSPHLWEGLFSIHLDITLPKKPKIPPMAVGRYFPGKVGDRCFLLDVCTYRFYPISENQHNDMCHFLF